MRLKRIIILCLFALPIPAFAGWVWQNPLPQGNGLQAVSFSDNSTGYIVGNYNTIIKTTDGGTSWTLQTANTIYSLTSVCFPADAQTGFVAGRESSVYCVMHTTDGGVTWMYQNTGTHNSLFDIWFSPGDQTGYTVGATGTILKTTDGGTWTKEDKADEHVTSNTIKITIAPNPFHKQLNIKFQNTNFKNQINMEIFDVSGRCVQSFRLTLDALRATQIFWDGCNEKGEQLPSGVYFIAIKTEEHRETKKVVLIR